MEIIVEADNLAELKKRVHAELARFCLGGLVSLAPAWALPRLRARTRVRIEAYVPARDDPPLRKFLRDLVHHSGAGSAFEYRHYEVTESFVVKLIPRETQAAADDGPKPGVGGWSRLFGRGGSAEGADLAERAEAWAAIRKAIDGLITTGGGAAPSTVLVLEVLHDPNRWQGLVSGMTERAAARATERLKVCTGVAHAVTVRVSRTEGTRPLGDPDQRILASWETRGAAALPTATGSPAVVATTHPANDQGTLVIGTPWTPLVMHIGLLGMPQQRRVAHLAIGQVLELDRRLLGTDLEALGVSGRLAPRPKSATGVAEIAIQPQGVVVRHPGDRSRYTNGDHPLVEGEVLPYPATISIGGRAPFEASGCTVLPAQLRIEFLP